MTGKSLLWTLGGGGILLGLGLLAYVVAAYTAGRPDRAVFNPDWDLCIPDDSCVAVAAPCGEWEPVNSVHEEEAAAYYGHLIEVVESNGMLCMSVNLDRRKPAAYCVRGVCSLAQ